MKSILSLILLAFLAGCSSTPVSLSTAAQLEKDVAIIDKYLTDNSITAQSDVSGLRYVVTSTGTGAKPTVNNTVVVKYVGKLLSTGAIFDQTSGTSTFSSKLSQLIPGWQIGLPLVGKGSKVTLYIPSGLAYGSTGVPGIPANSNLIFDIELVDVK